MFNWYNLQGGNNIYRTTFQKSLSETCRRVMKVSEWLGWAVRYHPFFIRKHTGAVKREERKKDSSREEPRPGSPGGDFPLLSLTENSLPAWWQALQPRQGSWEKNSNPKDHLWSVFCRKNKKVWCWACSSMGNHYHKVNWGFNSV